MIVNFRSDEAGAQAVVKDIVAAGGAACAFAADASRAGEVSELFNFAEREFGGVDTLVNNAGALIASPLADISDADYQRLVSTNLDGAFLCMREAARRLRDGGRIVNISSSTVATNPVRLGVYTATKAAVETMMRILAKELGARGITVNAVAPGAVATELFRSQRSVEEARAIEAQIPLGRMGEPEDIASVVAFLVSDDGGWVNGQVVRANGGRA